MVTEIITLLDGTKTGEVQPVIETDMVIEMENDHPEILVMRSDPGQVVHSEMVSEMVEKENEGMNEREDTKEIEEPSVRAMWEQFLVHRPTTNGVGSVQGQDLINGMSVLRTLEVDTETEEAENRRQGN